MDGSRDQPWFWGEMKMSAVEDYMRVTRPGTFLVFNDGPEDTLMLAVRRSRGTEYTTIYYRDSLYGFTEPLGFETLDEVLDAVNTSPIHGNCLLYPASYQNNDTQENSDETRDNDVLSCLLKVRTWHKQLMKTADDRDELLSNIEELDEDLQDYSRKSDGLHMVLKMLEAHLDKHYDLQKRMSFAHHTDIQAFNDNEQKLLHRLTDIQKKKHEVDKHIVSLQKEKAEQSKTCTEYATCINDLEKHIQQTRGLLESNSENFVEFLEGLLWEDSSEQDSDIEVASCTKSQSEKTLQMKPEGSFLVRESRRVPSLPFYVSVRYGDSVEHFPVVSRDGHLGFDETTCIFDGVDDLVDAYSRISFGVHQDTYGDLVLRSQVPFR